MKIFTFKNIFILLFGLSVYWLTTFLYTQWQSWGKTSYVAFTKPETVIFSENGRTNIALLGLGGDGHEGGDLADTLIIASIKTVEPGSVSLISIPRDLWIPDLQAKINHATRIGGQTSPEAAVSLMKKSLSQVSGLPIHYYLQVDFHGFVALIDQIGGVDIDVEHSFIDTHYPIPGKENAYPESDRYETITFQAGRQHMDGATALKFVRSRYAQGTEGNDIARSHRQQLVLSTLREQVLTRIVSNPQSIAEYQNLATTYIKTDITPDLYPAFARIGLSMRSVSPQHILIPTALDTHNQATDLLIHPGISKSYEGQWVLIARNNNFEQVHEYLNKMLLQ